MEIRLWSRSDRKRRKGDGQAAGGALAPSTEEVLVTSLDETRSQGETWLRQLRDDPSSLADVEVAIHALYRQQADRLTAALLSSVASSAELAEHAAEARLQAQAALRAPEKKSLLDAPPSGRLGALSQYSVL